MLFFCKCGVNGEIQRKQRVITKWRTNDEQRTLKDGEQTWETQTNHQNKRKVVEK